MLNNKNQAQNYMAYEIIISENMNKKKRSLNHRGERENTYAKNLS